MTSVDQSRKEHEKKRFNKAVDLSIVYPYEDKDPGTRAAEQAQSKWNAHHQGVEAAEHIFVPFVMETTGYLDLEKLSHYYRRRFMCGRDDPS